MVRSVLVASALVVTAIPQTSTPTSGQQLPTFRTGVDIVEVDVTVLDKNRQPVKGLTADDFTILDRGRPQPIVAFSAMDVPPPTAYSAPWMRDAPFDVVTNVDNRRLVTIVMDDAYTDFNPDLTKRAKQIARNAVDELGPADLASVIFTFTGRAQNFTSDRSRLLAAIESYVAKQHGEPPMPCEGHAKAVPGMASRRGGMGTHKCDIEALAGVAEALSTSSPGRKVVIFISGGRTFNFSGDGSNDAAELTKLFRDLQRANITVYAFDARGLTTAGMSMGNQLSDPFASPAENESLYTFAANTGGRTIANTNDPQSRVAETFRESSSYYFIGFRTAASSNDNALHKVEVRVNRPGVQAQTRRGYYPPGDKAAARELINGLPSGDLPVHATAAVVGVPGRREAEVVIAARLDSLNASNTERTIELSATAIDLEAKVKGAQRQRITVVPMSHRWLDLPARLRLSPGRYLIQVTANAQDRTGAVVVDVDVPNFSKEALSVSGLILQRRPTPAIEDRSLAALLPFPPTAERQFRSSDDVAVFLRIYQGGKDRILPVRMSASVKNEKNAVTSSYDSTLEAPKFSEARSADYELSLPLAQLSPGEFLLEVEAQSGGRRVSRTARFSVVK